MLSVSNNGLAPSGPISSGVLNITSDGIASLQSGARPLDIDFNGDHQVNADDYVLLDRAIARFQSDPPADGILRIQLPTPTVGSNIARP